MTVRYESEWVSDNRRNTHAFHPRPSVGSGHIPFVAHRSVRYAQAHCSFHPSNLAVRVRHWRSGVSDAPYGHGKRQHKFLARRSNLFGGRKNSAEIVAGMAKTARRHVAVEEIDVAHKTRVEKRCL